MKKHYRFFSLFSLRLRTEIQESDKFSMSTNTGLQDMVIHKKKKNYNGFRKKVIKWPNQGVNKEIIS